MGAKPRKFRPTSVTLRNREWPIHYVQPEHEQLASGDPDAHNLGCCNCHTRQIYIDKTQSDDSLQNTLYHEIAHAYVLGSGEYTDYDLEERSVCQMTEWLIELEAAGLVVLKIK